MRSHDFSRLRISVVLNQFTLGKDLLDLDVLIKDYEIELRLGEQVERRMVTDNINRINTFVVNREIDGIKIIPKANYGSTYFEIFGVKIY